MSVNYNAGLIYGWKLTKAQYETLPEAIVEQYGVWPDSYNESGYFYVGKRIEEVPEAVAVPIDEDSFYMNFAEYTNLIKFLPAEVSTKYPNPSIYLYCRVS